MPKPWENTEGDSDLTAYHGTKDVIKQETEEFKRMQELNRLVRQLADLVGFEITNRMVFKSKRTGKEYR